jgi:hypothetical protein
MKKISILFTLLALLFAQTGCKKFVEGYDVSPNDPLDVNIEVLLTGSQVATIANLTGNLSRISSVLVQQMNGRQFQYEDIQQYVIRETTIDNEFSGLYTTGMLNAEQVIGKAGETNRYYRGIGRIIKVLNLGVATDMWGDVPNTQALGGVDNFNPAYDSQESILRDIQTTLDGAIADLSTAPADNVKLPSVDDLMFGGDVDKWRNVARILKARYHNRLSKRDAAGSANAALAALDAAYADGLNDKDDDLMAPFGEATNEWNQWYAFEQQRAGYITLNQTFLDILTGDPRLPLYASGTDQDPIGPFYGSQTSALPLATFFEAKFIEAEAALRANQPMRAATAYNDAVKANLTKLGVADPAYITANANEDAGSITLEKIMRQKYIAMFTQPEVWSDWRRTNLPALTPNAGAIINEIPRRLPTCQTERLYNTNAQIVTDLTSRVWWDQ